MNIAILILIIITCAVIAFFVLIQNPKGGGLSGEFGGMGTQLMGAKQSTDVVEKGTWVSAAVLLVLVLGSFVMADKSGTAKNQKSKAEEATKANKIPAAPAPVAPQAPAAPVTNATPPTGNTAPTGQTN